MLNAISRYGVRVVPNTLQVIKELEARRELVEGPHVARFEAAFAARLGPVHAITASFGRMAFYYILKALDLPTGGEIVMPALTFWVMPEMARRAGLTPVFADVDPNTFNVTASSIERVLTPRTVAIVPTHLWGLPCDMDEIMSLATQRGLRVIEDCAHALGALYRGRPVGTFGDAAVFSFQTIKPLNAYGGGMAVVRDAALAARVIRLAAAAGMPTVKRVTQRLWQGRVMRLATRPDVFTWTLFPLLYMGTRLHWSIDMYFWERIRPLEPLPAEYCERISNVQAAIALEGLGRLDAWTAARQHHAAKMSRWLDGIPGIRVPVMAPDRSHAYYQYCVYVPARDAVVDYCLRRAIDLETLHVDLCAELPLFGRHPGAPGARETTATVQVPVYESLTDAQLYRVADVLRDAVRAQDARTPATVHASP